MNIIPRTTQLEPFIHYVVLEIAGAKHLYHLRHLSSDARCKLCATMGRIWSYGWKSPKVRGAHQSPSTPLKPCFRHLHVTGMEDAIRAGKRRVAPNPHRYRGAIAIGIQQLLTVCATWGCSVAPLEATIVTYSVLGHWSSTDLKRRVPPTESPIPITVPVPAAWDNVFQSKALTQPDIWNEANKLLWVWAWT